ncbi:SGNH/GDSL hydrolase family protein [Actinoplanes sp. NPDC051633]|uniref:SGNH/GDSL hydrolase family protein n=1 Tax=Actinoplanes sp. NPDC051633 TaxID=3155670 RepID=UPI0034390182
MRTSAGAFWAAVAVLVGQAVTVLPAGAVEPPTRIMVVGDSISQGLEGDYTWRYRLANHLAAAGGNVDFVGPWTGTNVVPAGYPAGWPEVSIPPSRNGAYRPGIAFDSNHLSQWGWQMHQAKDVIAANVTTYTPDFLLIELGFNDLAWGVNNPAGLLNDLRTLVANARSVKPNLRFAIANITHRSALSEQPTLPAIITEYNSLLASSIGQINTATSPAIAVDVDGPFDANLDTYDGLHPNVRGEWVIAKAFGDALFAGWWFGGFFASIPTSLPADLTPAAPTTITTTNVDFKVKVQWSHSFGAAGYKFFQRDATAGEAFREAQFPIGADSWTADVLPAGHLMQFYVKATRGPARMSAASPTGSATVKALPAPANVRVSTDPNRPYGVTVAWDPVAGADDYHVYSAPGCDVLPPAAGAFTLQQWALGSRTSWTQDYVFSDCINYKVAASRNGGESPLPFAAARALPYQNNFNHLLARNRYFDAPPESGDVKAGTTTAAGTDRGIVVARGYIRDKDTFTGSIGDHRQWNPNPYSSAKIGVAWDTKTGQIGVYVHKSCVIGSSLPPFEAGCRTALPIRFVPDATIYGDSNSTPYNYVSAVRSGSSLIVAVSAMNAWSASLGRINGKVTLTPSGSSFAATLVADKFPAWEIYRYPRTAPLSGTVGVFYAIGTRDQTGIGDLKTAQSTCTSVPPEGNAFTKPMSC